jgi:hypothetical protein
LSCGFACKLSVTTKERKSYTHRRVPGREEKHDDQKILLIGEEIVEVQANTVGISSVVGFSVLGCNYSFTESFRSPPQQKRENHTHVGEHWEEGGNMIIKKFC